jgi:hypothetical protein
MHRDQVIIILSDFLILGLISGLKAKLLEQILQPNGISDIFRGKALFKSLELGHVAELEAFLNFFEHHLFGLTQRKGTFS